MFYDNLKAECERQNLKITPIVAECGGAKGSISNWKNGAAPNSDIVMRLAVRLNVSSDYLLFGSEERIVNLSPDEQELLSYYKQLDPIPKGQVLGKAETLMEQKHAAEEAAAVAAQKEAVSSTPQKTITFCEPEPEEVEIEPETTQLIYFDLAASAGRGTYIDGEAYKLRIEVPKNPLTLAADFAVKITGDSMEPRYHDGDIVLVKSQNVELGEIGIFNLNGESFIKKAGNGQLISLNPKYKPRKLIDGDECRTQGKVIGTL